MVHFAIVYFFGGIFASLFPYTRNHENQNYTSLGASGAVSSVVFAAILWNPTMKLALLFLPIPIPAYIFGPLYLAFEYFALRRGKGNIAHDAHIGGALFGILYVLLIEPSKGSEFVQLIFN
jgi:membrane associated rhomboid family serine protease